MLVIAILENRWQWALIVERNLRKLLFINQPGEAKSTNNSDQVERNLRKVIFQMAPQILILKKTSSSFMEIKRETQKMEPRVEKPEKCI